MRRPLSVLLLFSVAGQQPAPPAPLPSVTLPPELDRVTTIATSPILRLLRPPTDPPWVAADAP